ncbi:MAG: L-rhamnose isomerase [Candidatus Hermodarchaeota archaeon]
MKSINLIETAYEIANQQYATLGIDTSRVIEKLKTISISLHCWQGDDVGGFEKPDAELSGGGIQVTGNYPGKARTILELRQDYEKVFSLIPGNHRVNLHAIYGDFGGKKVDRNKIEPSHFQSWINWAKEHNLKLDFNSTLFSHPNADSGFTLSHKQSGIRDFWIEHVKSCRKISAEMGKQLGSPVIHNLWIPDGSKDIPVDRKGHRALLKASLDQIFEEKYSSNQMKDALEGKLFGIGSESFVVGSHEFYLCYAISKGLIPTLDIGHYHPTESVADKISAILPFSNELLLHVSRGVRWDSDHVVILNDEVVQLAEEIVRSHALDRIHIALDFFDASINRIGAWVIGARATLKALLYALLEPWDMLREYEENSQYFQRLNLLEELKTMPFGAVWDYYCLQMGVATERLLIQEIEKYEANVLIKRG